MPISLGVSMENLVMVWVSLGLNLVLLAFSFGVTYGKVKRACQDIEELEKKVEDTTKQMHRQYTGLLVAMTQLAAECGGNPHSKAMRTIQDLQEQNGG